MLSLPPEAPVAPPEPTPVISTGVPALDTALGIGGWPLGRLVEVLGPASVGKTTLALHAVAAVQARGAQAMFVDADGRFDPAWAEARGVNLRRMILAQPDHGEQALDIVEAMIRSGAVPLVIVDSVAGLGSSEDAADPLSRRMSKIIRTLVPLAERTQTTVLFTNTLRVKTGVTFGPHEVTEGGNALKYYASVRVVLRPDESTERGVLATVVKNKLAPPFRKAALPLAVGPETDPHPPTRAPSREEWVELGRMGHRDGLGYNACPFGGDPDADDGWREGWILSSREDDR